MPGDEVLLDSLWFLVGESIVNYMYRMYMYIQAYIVYVIQANRCFKQYVSP